MPKSEFDPVEDTPAPKAEPADFRVRIVRKTMLTGDIVHLECKAVEPAELNVEPGAWMFFHMPPTAYCPEGVKRPFSVASDTRDRTVVDFIIRRNPKGICTRWIFEDMRDGDEVTVNGPHGDFRLSGTGREAIFIAGGSGLSAIRSLLFQLVALGVRTPKVSLYFGATNRANLYMTDELSALENVIPNFRFKPSLSRPEPTDNWDGKTGNITILVGDECGDCSEKEAYLCGGPGMIDACIKVLTEHGMPADRIYYDKFQ
jgi:Na+-transporting NADH:ubiquinone oxidoreductase subunit F